MGATLHCTSHNVNLFEEMGSAEPASESVGSKQYRQQQRTETRLSNAKRCLLAHASVLRCWFQNAVCRSRISAVFRRAACTLNTAYSTVSPCNLPGLALPCLAVTLLFALPQT